MAKEGFRIMTENTSLQTLNYQQKATLWLSRIEACRSSGMRVQDWCAEQGLSYHTYYKWQQRLFRSCAAETQKFYEVNCVEPGGSTAVTLRTGEYRLDIYAGADSGTIASVLKAIKEC